MADLHFELVTPERLVLSEDVRMVVVPGSEGDFGVLAGHAPVMSTIRDGELAVYRSEGAEPERIDIDHSSGFDVLDEAARQSVAKWRFHPAHFGERQIPSIVRIPIVFTLVDATK